MIEREEWKNDSIYNFMEGRNKHQVCIPFSRSDAVCDDEEDSVREQFNAVTAFLDMSAIYGSEDQLATQLRVREEDFKKRGQLWENIGTLKENNQQKWNLPTRFVLVQNINPQIFISGSNLGSKVSSTEILSSK